MSSLLITGGAGFIGSNFVRYWRMRHPEDKVVVLDALTYAGNRANLAGIADIVFVHGDIRDYELVKRLLAEHGTRTLVHFAAETHVDRSIHGPDAFFAANVDGTHALLKAARAAWLDSEPGIPHRFHNVSTDEVFGSLTPEAEPFRETTAYAPNSPYSASKAAADHLVRAYHRTYGLQVTTSHCSNNYGPRQFPEKLIPLFLINALLAKPLPIYGDGLNVRDWLHVDDHCRGIELILAKGVAGECYNIGGGAEMHNLEIAQRICDAVDAAFKLDPLVARRYPSAPAARGDSTRSLRTFVKDRPGHDRRYAIDDSKIRAALGYVPTRSFEEGLASTIEWYLTNEDWWRGVIDGSYREWLDVNYAAR